MCCFLIALFAVGPRLAFLVYWLIQPAYVQGVFNTWIWPLLGLIFLPWTTLMYTLAYGSQRYRRHRMGADHLRCLCRYCHLRSAAATSANRSPTTPVRDSPTPALT